MLQAIAALFFALNSLGMMPVCIGLLQEYPAKRQLLIMLREVIIMLVLLLGVAFFGNFLFGLIGIKPPTISFIGGLILFWVGGTIAFARKQAEVKKKREPFIVPIACPLIVGSATMTTAMMFGSRAGSQTEVFLTIFSAWFLTAAVLLLAPVLSRFLHPKVSSWIARGSGIILMYMGIRMAASIFI